jgi:ElaB/YqjD/DUF883 family membrane-anchored ribosome-binding protein
MATQTNNPGTEKEKEKEKAKEKATARSGGAAMGLDEDRVAMSMEDEEATARRLEERVSGRMTRLRERVERVCRERPFTALGVAFVAGALLRPVIFGRRR